MLHTPLSTHSEIEHEILERVRSIAPRFSARAAESERARQISSESIHELLDAGIARTLVPRHFGGYGLGIETWFDIVREISRADASHGWCASIIIHHAHVVGCFPEEAQESVWTGGPDVAIAASIMPTAHISPTEGGYFLTTQQSAFASGVGHSSWAIVGGLVRNGEASDWMLFLVPASEFQIRDTWFTTGMSATGSNTIIIPDRIFVPKERTLRVVDLRDGNGPGALTNCRGIYQLPFGSYAGLAFATPMLGATEGAYDHLREWIKTRRGSGGTATAEISSVQVSIGRAAANIDAAELLLRRAARSADLRQVHASESLARSVRDFARAGELIVGAIDAIIGLSGTAGFMISNPIQRVWRDVHFASTHVSLNAESNFAHFGRIELGIETTLGKPFF